MLKNYRVTLRRTTNEKTVVSVAARSPAEAADIALSVEENGLADDWTAYSHDEPSVDDIDIEECEAEPAAAE